MLTGPRLTLREFTEDDLEAVHRFESLPEVARYTTHPPRSLDEVRTTLNANIAAQFESPRKGYDLALVVSGEVVGRAGFMVHDGGEAMLWYVLHPDHWGHGYATEAARLLLDFGFGTRGFHRMYADIDPLNLASCRVVERLGMRREAHFVENVLILGRWTDTLIYALLDREWRLNAQNRQ